MGGAYKTQTGIGLNYQSIGSGGGIKQIKAKTVTFGASDKPLKASDLDEAGLTQFPAIVGGTVLVVNLAGIKPGELVLDGDTTARIFLGEITQWDDPKIKALNPNVICRTRRSPSCIAPTDRAHLPLRHLPGPEQLHLVQSGGCGYRPAVAGRHRRQGQ
jgi:ABC-type phosphate transport system, periplasmic component